MCRSNALRVGGWRGPVEIESKPQKLKHLISRLSGILATDGVLLGPVGKRSSGVWVSGPLAPLYDSKYGRWLGSLRGGSPPNTIVSDNGQEYELAASPVQLRMRLSISADCHPDEIDGCRGFILWTFLGTPPLCPVLIFPLITDRLDLSVSPALASPQDHYTHYASLWHIHHHYFGSARRSQLCSTTHQCKPFIDKYSRPTNLRQCT